MEFCNNSRKSVADTASICLSKRLFAHSLAHCPTSTWQPLDTHLNAVASRASSFAAAFDSSWWAWQAGVLHDIGKAADEFQAYLRRENHIDDEHYDGLDLARVNHSSAGTALAEEWYNEARRPFGRILGYLIAGHHAGLPDFETSDGGRGALTARLAEGRKDLERIKNVVRELERQCRTSLGLLPNFVKKENLHFWMRFLFSCLVDADFLDTEGFIQPEQAGLRRRPSDLRIFKQCLDEHLSNIAEAGGHAEINKIRQQILKACRTAASSRPGLFTLTVPTGGGKTLSATAFALEHAILHEKRRIIYVIPYTSIIEQTAQILADVFGQENVIQHHSNLDPEKETVRSRLASENWDAPIVVTTNVQFFESLFSARPSRCRKLHNVCNSVVILDEAQLIPPEKLSPCVAAINELTNHYDVTVLLSTATQPALPKLLAATEIIPPGLGLYERLKRTEIVFPETLETKVSFEELAAKLVSHPSVLCIVNTRRDCYELFKLMPAGTVHLSALMCGEHRSVAIGNVKTSLSAGTPVRVVSTQLVEAGVDIDFPIVFRALAGLDSVIQAAGRCNREGRLGRLGQVFVFLLNQQTLRGPIHKGATTTRELLSLPGLDLQTPSTFTRYFELFYDKLSDTGDELFRRLIPSDASRVDIAFRTVGDSFRIVDDRSARPVFVRYGLSDEFLKQLKIAGPSRILMRNLQRYTVNLPVYLVNRMFSDGLLEEVWPGFLAQADLPIYNDAVGLDIFSTNIPFEDLIV